MFDKLMGSLARKAERRTEEKTLRSARDMRAHLHTLAIACQAVIAACNERRDPIAAIEQQIAWPRFVKCVNAAQAMTAADVVDGKAELLTKYTTLRTFAPALLEAFDFQGDRSVSSLLKARHTARDVAQRQRSLPANAPTAFVRPSWRQLYFRTAQSNVVPTKSACSPSYATACARAMYGLTEADGIERSTPRLSRGPVSTC